MHVNKGCVQMAASYVRLDGCEMRRSAMGTVADNGIIGR